MKIDDFHKVLEQLKSLNLFFVNLSGGEPFLHPSINEILLATHNEFKHVTTISNGTMLKEDHLKTIGRISKNKGGFPIQVSIDSYLSDENEKVRSANTDIIDNFSKLLDVGANLTIAMVVSTQNQTHIVESIRRLSRYTKHFHIMPVKQVKALKGADEYLLIPEDEMKLVWSRIGELRDELDLKVRIPCTESCSSRGEAHGAPCMAAFTQMVIDPNLSVRPCDRVTDRVIGDLKESSVQEVWNDVGSYSDVLLSDLPYCEKVA